ncbi:MAG: RpiB/LacA/LacB family sugar-phosphate isomerase [Muricomes sp.]|uniref:RpiB/LacA/LacB family sugar-phosphate isomerase n=1 Tax=Faecalicatena contorta TaxID=39482 RepID=UPI002EB5DAED|nr:RpiB/LacA/LacB family sugar-phosphate isomerase [Muricomes sp.]
MKIAIGCDPNAAEYKKILVPYIQGLGHECIDYGSLDPIYANTAVKVAENVVAGNADRGILICGTGIGVCIAANKVKGAYAALVNNIYQAQRAQLSNNANIITIGAQVTGIELAKCLVKEYLETAYIPTARSATKIDRIIQYENNG